MHNFSAPFVSAFRRLVNVLKSADRIIPYFPFANPYKQPDQKSYVGCDKQFAEWDAASLQVSGDDTPKLSPA